MNICVTKTPQAGELSIMFNLSGPIIVLTVNDLKGELPCRPLIINPNLVHTSQFNLKIAQQALYTFMFLHTLLLSLQVPFVRLGWAQHLRVCVTLTYPHSGNPLVHPTTNPNWTVPSLSHSPGPQTPYHTCLMHTALPTTRKSCPEILGTYHMPPKSTQHYDPQHPSSRTSNACRPGSPDAPADNGHNISLASKMWEP